MKVDKMFGVASVIFALGYFARSIPFANAISNGLNTSYSQNPIFNEFQKTTNVTTGNTFTLATAPSDQALVITGYEVIRDVSSCYYSSDQAASKCDNSFVLNGVNHSQQLSPLLTNQSGLTLKVEPGQSLTVTTNKGSTCSGSMTCRFYLQGYYTHP